MEAAIVIPFSFNLPPPPVIQSPDWEKKPTPDELGGSWPLAALRAGKGGSATIRCIVASDGLLHSCDVVSETPEGLGFGGAALAMAPLFVMKPAARDGKPIGGARVTIPINFNCNGSCEKSVMYDAVRLYRYRRMAGSPDAGPGRGRLSAGRPAEKHRRRPGFRPVHVRRRESAEKLLDQHGKSGGPGIRPGRPEINPLLQGGPSGRQRPSFARRPGGLELRLPPSIAR